MHIFDQAKDQLKNHAGKILIVSSVYETEPWGNQNQNPFLNQVLKIETPLNSYDLLVSILQIEKALGRIRKERWAPRTLDIDILYFNDEIIVTRELKIPHKEMHRRNFVLIPLAEIAPDFRHPVFNITNKDLLKRCEDKLGVKKLN